MAGFVAEINGRLRDVRITGVPDEDEDAPIVATRQAWLAPSEAVLAAYVADWPRGRDGIVTVGSVEDGGDALTPEELRDVVLPGWQQVARRSGWALTPVHTEPDGSALAHCLLRRAVDEDTPEFVEVHLATLGNVDAGKSTLLGVLGHLKLDDGRGRARRHMLRHSHEDGSGRTSSVNQVVMGFNADGAQVDAVNKHNHKLNWALCCARAAKVVTCVDLAGHAQYHKTTVFGMTAHRPDYVMIVVGANSGLVGTTQEHLKLAVTLGRPFMIVVTKVDMAPPQVRDATLAMIERIVKKLRGATGGRLPLRIRSRHDTLTAHRAFARGDVAPIFCVSNVTGQGLDELRCFINLLPVPPPQVGGADEPLFYQVDETFNVPGVGPVVSGTVLRGTVRVEDNLALGPMRGGTEPVSVQIRSIHRHRVPSVVAVAGQKATLALRRVAYADLRQGLALTSPTEAPQPTWQFEADVVLFMHQSSVNVRYQAMVHVGAVKQAAKVMAILECNGEAVPLRLQNSRPRAADKRRGHDDGGDAAGAAQDGAPMLRSGDRARVRLRFNRRPEVILPGQALVMREGLSKAVGIVLATCPELPGAPPPGTRERAQRIAALDGGGGAASSRRQRRRVKEAAASAAAAAGAAV